MAHHSHAWTDAQKTALVEQIVRRRITLQHACSQYGLSTDELKDWVRIFRRSARQALDRQLRSTLSIQGLDVEELSSAELSGKLGDISLADLFQTIAMGRKDAVISITHDGVRSSIWCKAGRVVDAQSLQLSGKPALMRLLSLERGSVHAAFSPVDRPATISASTQELLLESAAFRDHRNRLVQRLGPPPHVMAVVPGVAARQVAELNPHELAVLSLFDGVRSIEQVIVRGHLSDLETLEVARRFFEAGLIGPTTLAAESERTPTSSISAFSSSYRPRPSTASARRRRVQPPRWVLAGGAIACSSLGAVTAIAYAGSLRWSADPAASSGVTASAPRCPAGMALIQGGEFTMGSNSNHPALRSARPAHRVAVGTFCLDSTEVTVERYRSCQNAGQCASPHERASFLRAGGVTNGDLQRSEALHSQRCNAGKSGRDQHPINCVSYYQAASYCSFMGGRLPSEQEWELAARGTGGRHFPWGTSAPDERHVNACGPECERWHREVGLARERKGLVYSGDDGFAGTAPVGSFPQGATPEGVHDLIGNVFEWTSGSLYAYDSATAAPLDAGSAVIRGGSYNSGTPELLDPALRFALEAERHSQGVGFRCAAAPSGL